MDRLPTPEELQAFKIQSMAIREKKKQAEIKRCLNRIAWHIWEVMKTKGQTTFRYSYNDLEFPRDVVAAIAEQGYEVDPIYPYLHISWKHLVSDEASLPKPEPKPEPLTWWQKVCRWFTDD
jgi:hypothetical protein